jgi:hypothetical protein
VYLYTLQTSRELITVNYARTKYECYCTQSFTVHCPMYMHVRRLKKTFIPLADDTLIFTYYFPHIYCPPPPLFRPPYQKHPDPSPMPIVRPLPGRTDPRSAHWPCSRGNTLPKSYIQLSILYMHRTFYKSILRPVLSPR